MNPFINRQGRQKIFAGIVIGCIALAVGYTAWVIQRADAGVNPVQAGSQGMPPSTGVPNELDTIQGQPHLLFVNLKQPEIAQVKLAALDTAISQRAQTALTCERVHYAAGNGICLMYDTTGLGQLVWVTLFDSDFNPRHRFSTEGILSRARVSPDGRYAAFTVFVTGQQSSSTQPPAQAWATWKNSRPGKMDISMRLPSLTFGALHLLRIAINFTPRFGMAIGHIWCRAM
jgi:hypothetical protein